MTDCRAHAVPPDTKRWAFRGSTLFAGRTWPLANVTGRSISPTGMKPGRAPPRPPGPRETELEPGRPRAVGKRARPGLRKSGPKFGHG